MVLLFPNEAGSRLSWFERVICREAAESRMIRVCSQNLWGRVIDVGLSAHQAERFRLWDGGRCGAVQAHAEGLESIRVAYSNQNRLSTSSGAVRDRPRRQSTHFAALILRRSHQAATSGGRNDLS